MACAGHCWSLLVTGGHWSLLGTVHPDRQQACSSSCQAQRSTSATSMHRQKQMFQNVSNINSQDYHAASLHYPFFPLLHTAPSAAAPDLDAVSASLPSAIWQHVVDSLVDSDSSLSCEQHPGCNSRLRLKHHAAAYRKASLWFCQDLLHSTSLTQSRPKQRDAQVVELHRCGT